MKKLLLFLFITLLHPTLHAQDINQCGLDDNPVLTDVEAEFLNNNFTETEKNGFDFKGKKIMIIGGSSASYEVSKSTYFEYIKETGLRHQIFKRLFPLTPEEKVKSGGYDAFIGFYNKMPVNTKKISRKLSKGKFKKPKPPRQD